MEIMEKILRSEVETALKQTNPQTAWASVIVNGIEIVGLRPIGSKLWFEYHCWESPESADADLWYHSHQQVEILGLVDLDEPVFWTTWEERLNEAHQIVYKARFEDGFEYEVLEDELLDSPKEFERPNPPKKEQFNERQIQANS
jgi:hypothetical protein